MGKPNADRFTGATQAWFDAGEELAERAASGELPEEEGGRYVDTRRRVVGRVIAIAAGVAALAGAACALAGS